MNEVKLKVYLDTSVLNRIFDDQTQARIYLESISMQLIFLLIEKEVIEIVSSIETSAKIKGVDALHIACAEAIEADYFITCDDRMIKRYSGSLAVKTPVEFVAIIFNA